MTYLDPSHPHERNWPTKFFVRIAFALGIAIFGWYALTLGTDQNGVPVIVPEPVAQSS